MSGVGFQNSFPMGVGGFRRSQTSVRLSLRRFTWHSCCNSEEPGPKTQEIISTLPSLLAFILTFSVTLLSPSLFSYSFFLLGWQAGKSSLCIFSVAVTFSWQNKARANPVLVHLNGPIEARRQRQHGADPRGTGAGAVGGHGALMTQQSPCPLSARLFPLAAVP